VPLFPIGTVLLFALDRAGAPGLFLMARDGALTERPGRR